MFEIAFTMLPQLSHKSIFPAHKSLLVGVATEVIGEVVARDVIGSVVARDFMGDDVVASDVKVEVEVIDVIGDGVVASDVSVADGVQLLTSQN